jgi:DNA polymerase-3 subunit gamma/tau
VSFEKNVLTIGFDPEFAEHLQLVDNPKNHALLRTKLEELGYPRAQARFIQAEAPPREIATAPQPPPALAPPERAAAAPEPAASSKVDFKNDPLIRKALEVFKGQIIEVRS